MQGKQHWQGLIIAISLQNGTNHLAISQQQHSTGINLPLVMLLRCQEMPCKRSKCIGIQRTMVVTTCCCSAGVLRRFVRTLSAMPSVLWMSHTTSSNAW